MAACTASASGETSRPRRRAAAEKAALELKAVQGASGIRSATTFLTDAQDDNPLGYYRQREWKIIENFARKDESRKAVWDVTPPDGSVSSELIEANGWLTEQISDGTRLIDQSLLLSSVPAGKVPDLIGRVIVPRAVLAEAQRIVGGRVEVVTSEGYHGTDWENGAGI